MVYRQHNNGIALRQIGHGRGALFDDSSACRDSSYFYREQAPLRFHGSIRETKGEKDRRSSAEDSARGAICGTTNAATASSGEGRRNSRAARDQKSGAPAFEGAIAARTRRGRMKAWPRIAAVAASRCEAPLHRAAAAGSADPPAPRDMFCGLPI